MPGEYRQFLLLNTNLERQVAFGKELAVSDIASGTPALHGTPSENIFQILQEGLKRSIYHPTVYYSDESETSILYVMDCDDPRPWTLGS